MLKPLIGIIETIPPEEKYTRKPLKTTPKAQGKNEKRKNIAIQTDSMEKPKRAPQKKAKPTFGSPSTNPLIFS